MKYIIIYTLLFYGFASARPQNWGNFRLTRYDHFNSGYGNYRYAFQINNDIFQEQNGELKLAKDNTHVTVTNGAYSIVTPDSVHQEVHYVADENGYRPHVVIAKQNVTVTTAVPITNSVTTNAATTTSQQSQSKPSTEGEISHPQVIAENTKQNNTLGLQQNRTDDSEDFPDRIGTPVIISLQGAPG
ncbi:hypothetical protein ILUMI_05688 [Ignelater luminosus]|uniref:Uncharacterized protein n=1 Tax=Ignelater luminosus TaxID=2038154 RepID=A0A8K0DC40_IGNLU|nr:hypothetical protein ILUMI_05688 [Ignelater luminosus]